MPGKSSLMTYWGSEKGLPFSVSQATMSRESCLRVGNLNYYDLADRLSVSALANPGLKVPTLVQATV